MLGIRWLQSRRVVSAAAAGLCCVGGGYARRSRFADGRVWSVASAVGQVVRRRQGLERLACGRAASSAAGSIEHPPKLYGVF